MICGQYDFFVVIANKRQWPHFPFKDFFRGHVCGYLKVGVSPLPFSNEIHFRIADLTDHHLITPAKKFKAGHVFKQEIQVVFFARQNVMIPGSKGYTDLITVKEFAEFLGYNPNSVVRWCNKPALKCFHVSGKYMIPKVCAIEFLATDTSLGVRRKSHKHQLFLSDFMNRNGIAR